MEIRSHLQIHTNIFTVIALFWAGVFYAQVDPGTAYPTPPSNFWQHVQIGGGLGLGFGSGYTDIGVSPSAIYNFNRYFAAGVGLTGSYVRYKNYSHDIDEYRSYIYGGSVIGLFNPIEQIQLSVEVEQLRVASRLETFEEGTLHRDFWNTGLFLGIGYHTQNVTVGVRYNILQDSDKTVYADALMPFVRIYF